MSIDPDAENAVTKDTFSSPTDVEQQTTGVDRFSNLIDTHRAAYTDATRFAGDTERIPAPTGSTQQVETAHEREVMTRWTLRCGGVAIVSSLVVAVSSTHVSVGDDSSNPWLNVMMVSLIVSVLAWIVTGGCAIVRAELRRAFIYVPPPIAAAYRDITTARKRLLAVEAPVEVLVKVDRMVRQSERMFLILADAEQHDRMHSAQAVAARDEVFDMAAEISALVEVATVRFKTIEVAEETTNMPRERLLADGASMIENTDDLRRILDGPSGT
jgi:hypothetical protein